MTREEAILCLKGMKNYARDSFTEQADWQNSLDIAIRALEQEPKTGHWDKGYTFPDGEYWKCTKCKELIKVKYPMKYCNNCGSKNE